MDPEEFNNFDRETENLDSIHLVPCIMNSGRIFQEHNLLYDAYTCTNCISLMTNICESCMFNCHKTHIVSGRKLEKRTMNIKLVNCDCACNNHQILKKLQTTKDITRVKTKKTIKCNILDIIFDLETNFVVYEKKSGEPFCPYCAHNCIEPEEGDTFDDIFEKRPKYKIVNTPECACTNGLKHGTLTENVNCLEMLIEGKEFEKYFNKFQLPGFMLKDKKNIERFFDILIAEHSNLSTLIDEGKSLDMALTQPDYINSVKLMYRLTKFMQGEHVYVSNPDLQSSFSIQFLLKVLDLKEVRDSKIVDMRNFSINFFRNLYVKPLSCYKPKRYLGLYENISPFHRLIYLDTFDAFLNKIKVSKSDFKKLLDLIFRQLTGYFDKVEDSKIVILIKEYIKLSHFMVHTKMTKKEDIDFFHRTVDKIQKVLGLAQKIKNIFSQISITAQKFFYDIIVSDNDLKFYDIIFPKKPEDSITETEFSFVNSEYNLTKLKGMFCFEKEEVNEKAKMRIPSVFNLLIQEDDLYLENLNNQLNNKQKFLFEDIIRIEDHKVAIDGVNLDVFKEKIKEAERLKKDYIEAQIDSENYCKKLLLQIDSLRNNVTSALSKEGEFGQFRTKIAWVKENFLNVIFSIWFNFNKNKKIKLDQEELYQSVNTSFVSLSWEFLKGTSFFHSFYLSNKVVKLIFDDFALNKVEFYYSILKEMKINNLNPSLDFLVETVVKSHTESKYKDDIKCKTLVIKMIRSSLKTCIDSSKPIIFDTLRLLIKKTLIEKEEIIKLIDNYKSDDADGLYLFAIFKGLEDLSLSFFTEISNLIPLNKITKLLEKVDLDIKLRRLFTEIYVKKTIILPFVNEKINCYSKFNVHKEHFKELMDLSHLQNSQANPSSRENDPDGIDEMLAPVIFNLEKYPMLSKKLGELPHKYFVKYFRDTILNPTYYSLYRIIFFSESISAKLKYNVFKLVYLFFECYRFFLFVIKEKSYAHDSFKWFFNGFESKTERQINSVIIVIISEIERNVQQIKSKEFEKLNLQNVLGVLNKHLEDFTIHMKNIEIEEEVKVVEVIDDNRSKNSRYSKSKEQLLRNTEESEVQEDENDAPNSFYIKIKDAVQIYSERKKVLDNNVLNDLFGPTDDQVLIRSKCCFISELLGLVDLPIDNTFYLPKNNRVFNDINKIIKIEPDCWQEQLATNFTFTRKLMVSISKEQLPFLFNLVLMNYLNSESDENSDSYQAMVDLIEFMRLLCENHNKVYQTWMFNKKYNSESFLKFMLDIPIIAINYISHFKDKRSLLFVFKQNKTLFFKPLIGKLTEFYIEISQGAIPYNYDVLSNTPEFKEYSDSHYKLIELIENEPDYEMIMSFYLKFIVTYVEENNNSVENKAVMIKMLNPKKLQVVMLYAFRKLYNQYFKYEQGYVPEQGHLQLAKLFLADEEFKQNDLFELASSLFIYFKMAAFTKQGFKCARLLENMASLIGQDLEKEKFKNILVTKRELYLLFDKLIKDVEIFYKEKLTIEEQIFKSYSELFDEKVLIDKMKEAFKKEQVGVNKVIFLTHPDSQFLNSNDIIRFVEASPVDDFNVKLDFVLEYYPKIISVIQMRKLLWKIDSIFLQFLFQLDIMYVEMISAVIAIIINLIQMDSLHLNKSNKIENNNSIINIISIFHMILLFFFVSAYWLFSFTKMKQNKNESRHLSLYKYISILWDKDIVPLSWSLVIGILANLHPSNFYLYSLQLFPIFNLFSTMRTVIYAVQIRYRQFISTTFLIIILILVYSSLSYYFFQPEFYNEDIKENLCETYFSCFFMLLNLGVRSGSIGFQMKSADDRTYWSEFLFEWVFFFSIILIMLNIINGIIVDTFQALREQNNVKDDVLHNVCYICSHNRSIFEMNGINFNHHREKEHSILNYYHYLIKVTLTDEQDLNSLDSMVLKSFNEHKADFFPVNSSLSLE